ncbi:MAG: branched-chain amino acid ABC transporter permease [Patescibacteria group bacterium]
MDILPQLILNSIIAGAIYSLLALGFNIIFGTVKFFDLGYGALTAVGGYAVFYFYKMLGLDLWLAVLLGVVIAAAVGGLINHFVYRPLRARKSSSMVLMVASLGAFTAVQAIIAILFTSQFQTLSQNSSAQRVYDIFGGVITEIQLVILVTGLVIMSGLALVLKKDNVRPRGTSCGRR